jgi:hypothetical protein
MSQATKGITTTLQPGARPAALSTIRGAHADLMARLQALPPYRFDARLQASPEQLELQAEILRCNLRAVERYVMAFLRDTAAHCHAIEIDRRYLGELFDDVIEDLCGPIETAAEKLREERAGRAA